MLKSFRYLLIPISLIYGAVVWLRNWFYDKNIFKSASFNFPIICVGNLAVGGTGKTPMTEYLIRSLQNKYRTATLSRGYKRKTSGFAIANAATTALEIGDEPMQFHQKFPDVMVAVGEERLVAIPQLLHEQPAPQVIILDDAFQHRAVRAGLNILLTEHKNLYYNDLMLPAGDLRDVRISSKRANIIVITKCKDITENDKENIIRHIAPKEDQQVFFTEIVYSKPYHLFTKATMDISPATAILLICGIANPKSLKDHLTVNVNTYDMLRYPDHHIFHTNDLAEIKKHFEKIVSKDKIILSTEKDAVRLEKFKEELQDLPIYVIPIEHHFLFDEGGLFNEKIFEFIESFSNKL